MAVGVVDHGLRREQLSFIVGRRARAWHEARIDVWIAQVGATAWFVNKRSGNRSFSRLKPDGIAVCLPRRFTVVLALHISDLGFARSGRRLRVAVTANQKQ
jgi:hypothetical protein